MNGSPLLVVRLNEKMMADPASRKLWRKAKIIQVIVVLGIAVATGGMLDMIAGQLLDPLRPSRLERLGVVVDTATGIPRFTKSIAREDAEEIIADYTGRRTRQSIIARAPPGPWVFLSTVFGLVVRGVLSPFVWVSVAVGFVYLRMAREPAG